MKRKFSLSELNSLVKGVVSDAFPDVVWVVAEISEIKVNHSGHCYLDLVEKRDKDDSVVAQARATIWSYTFKVLAAYFKSTTGQPLSEGLKILVQASVEFHELYGYSLNIRDIDSTYTVGDIARRRIEILERLDSDGVLNMNSELELPLVPQKIAVISSSTAAGYQDFMDQLLGNQYGLCFYTHLFPAVMQGKQAEESIIGALEHVYQYEGFFDLVVLIRGGGAQSDLSCFDSYELAYHITQFPLPVITGIGHEKDDTIADRVSHTKMKTPTAAAEFIIGSVAKFEAHLDELQRQIVYGVNVMISDFRQAIGKIKGAMGQGVQSSVYVWREALSRHVLRLNNLTDRVLMERGSNIERSRDRAVSLFFQYAKDRRRLLGQYSEMLLKKPRKSIEGNRECIDSCRVRLGQVVNGLIRQERHRLQLSEQKSDLLDPIHVLSRGYSITRHSGKVLKSSEEAMEGDVVETRLYQGVLRSKVSDIEK